jgi:hypothetical protein
MSAQQDKHIPAARRQVDIALPEVVGRKPRAVQVTASPGAAVTVVCHEGEPARVAIVAGPTTVLIGAQATDAACLALPEDPADRLTDGRDGDGYDLGNPPPGCQPRSCVGCGGQKVVQVPRDGAWPDPGHGPRPG